MKDITLALLKVNTEVFILIDQDNQVIGFKNLADGVRYFEQGYAKAHRRSYEGSMSACIAFLQVQPAIITVSGIPEIEDMVGDSPRASALSGVATPGLRGIKVLPEHAHRWDTGRHPKLVP